MFRLVTTSAVEERILSRATEKKNLTVCASACACVCVCDYHVLSERIDY